MSKYDVIVIGAGMSGMAASIRIGMQGKNVLLLEKHRIPGGLNSYYQRGKRQFDVGLHAMTNFSKKGSRRSPLGKLLKQLRIPYDDLNLCQQNHSAIQFNQTKIKFSNDFSLFESEFEKVFGQEVLNLKRLVQFLENYNEVDLNQNYFSAREKLKSFFKNPLAIEMLLCPLLIYGSAWENDMDFSQFAIMFKSIYLEGFSRPLGGVRTIINLLNEKLAKNNVEVVYGEGVEKILNQNKKVSGIVTTKGRTIYADQIFSSAGLPETMELLDNSQNLKTEIGNLSFCENIYLFDKLPKEFGINETILFHNIDERYEYQKPESLYNPNNAVICMPNNFSDCEIKEGVIRMTHIANFEYWNNLDKKQYKLEKEKLASFGLEKLKSIYPNLNETPVFTDVFTPTTVKKYTGHFRGTVYGSTLKSRRGETEIEDLFIIGTDQGFLGIVGAMLSGISMANLHSFNKEAISNPNKAVNHAI